MTFDLQSAATAFGEEMQSLLDGVLPYQKGTDPVLRQVAVTAGNLAFVVEIGTRTGGQAQVIPLLTSGKKTAELFVQLRLVADSAHQFPAVAKSKFELRVDRLPLLRLDFARDAHSVPGCHWNVHAERGAVTRLLAKNNPAHSGDLSKVHLPVGGFRMRPCLEDFLQLLVYEFKFDAEAGAQQVIDDGRVKWRGRQLAAMVRDDPETAARVLRDQLGYHVSAPESGPVAARVDRLTAW